MRPDCKEDLSGRLSVRFGLEEENRLTRERVVDGKGVQASIYPSNGNKKGKGQDRVRPKSRRVYFRRYSLSAFAQAATAHFDLLGPPP